VILVSYSSYSGASLTATPLTQKLLVQTEPAGAAAGVPFLQQPVVRLAAGDNSPIALAGILVSVGVLDGFISGTLTVPTDAAGVATFSNLKIGLTGTYNLEFTADGYGLATSKPLQVSTQGFIAIGGVGAGAGSVTGTGISCAYAASSGRTGTCVAGYPATSMVVLTGTGAPGSVFLGWSGSICSGGSPCTLSMASTHIIKAYFAEAAPLVNGVIAQILGTPSFTVVEAQLIDDQGNRNGGVDLGDLLSLLDRTGVSISPAVMDALARIAAAQADAATQGRIKR
jgi:hypothetical protein